MKPKPKLKQIKGSDLWLASYTSKDGNKYEVTSKSMKLAVAEWYSKFKKELKLGGG